MTPTAPAPPHGQPKRVCILTETYHPVRGGGEMQARTLAAGLTRLGWSVLVLTRRSDPASPRTEVLDGATIRRLPPTGRSRLAKWSLLATALWALLRHRREYDVVLVAGFRILGVPAVLVTAAMGKRCVLKADSLGEMSGEYFGPGLSRLGLTPTGFPLGALLLLRNALLRGAEIFVAISSPIHRELIAARVEPSRIAIVPNSVDTDRFSPVDVDAKRESRHRLGLAGSAFIVTFTGRLVSYKGLPLLLDVWRELTAEKEGYVLVLVGSGGLDMHNCEEQLRRYADDHGLSASIVFTGAVGNVHEYLQASDAFVFPSENEAFGISVIEAMAVGLPVVSTDAGGLADIVRDEENALRTKPGNGSTLKAALARLEADPELRRSLGRRGRQDALEEFAEEVVVGAYAKLLGSGRPVPLTTARREAP